MQVSKLKQNILSTYPGGERLHSLHSVKNKRQKTTRDLVQTETEKQQLKVVFETLNIDERHAPIRHIGLPFTVKKKDGKGITAYNRGVAIATLFRQKNFMLFVYSGNDDEIIFRHSLRKTLEDFGLFEDDFSTRDLQKVFKLENDFKKLSFTKCLLELGNFPEKKYDRLKLMALIRVMHTQIQQTFPKKAVFNPLTKANVISELDKAIVCELMDKVGIPEKYLVVSKSEKSPNKYSIGFAVPGHTGYYTLCFIKDGVLAPSNILNADQNYGLPYISMNSRDQKPLKKLLVEKRKLTTELLVSQALEKRPDELQRKAIFNILHERTKATIKGDKGQKQTRKVAHQGNLLAKLFR